MSENTKGKSGSRDISELKARLGLKKGDSAGGRAAKGGVVPPPNAGKIAGNYVPPPPGIVPPQPPQPVIPDARIDPFGAMNAIAQQGAQHAAPQIVIVNDGQPVESVAQKSKLTYLKWGAMVVVPLVLGFVIGGISYKNQAYNTTITDAKKLTDEVKELRNGLQALVDTLYTAKQRGRENFVPSDKQLTADLKALVDPKAGKLRKPDPIRLFHSNLYSMDPKLVEDTMQFYGDFAALMVLLDTHVRLSERDAAKTRKDSDFVKKHPGTLGVIFHVPDKDNQRWARVKLVEIAPFCPGEKTPRPEGCGEAPPAGFGFRSDPSQPWQGPKPWTKDAISLDGVAMVENNSALFQTLLAGAEPYFDLLSYMVRIKDIEGRATALQELRKSIENRLNQKAQESKRFSL